MKNILDTLYKIANVLVKIIPTIYDVIEDFVDDGRLNKSNRKPQPPLDSYDEEELN